MSVVARPFPSAQPHGELREILPGIYFVTGTVKLPGPLPVRFSRAMTYADRYGDHCFVGASGDGYCTKICASASDCPASWTCRRPGSAPDKICIR
jgi:hypothetical protein